MDGFEDALDSGGFIAILSDESERTSEDVAGLDLGEGLYELLCDGGPEVRSHLTAVSVLLTTVWLMDPSPNTLQRPQPTCAFFSREAL